ncbi:hypothetical protein EMPS_10880 [Entomortierella parvispora]|uniref:Uncharacterized protein n=1 Tax=Entomortierella parvispora TaxID=205924 RepID=A0A9P3M1F2_9FUNG|nr:hypothetical protein EMPS_10880 [Entomortierella parvispora]
MEGNDYDTILDDDPGESFVEQLEVLESTDNSVSITFQDDDEFLKRAHACLRLEPQDLPLERQLMRVCDEPEPLPRNEKIGGTLKVLQDAYGLVVDDGAESLAGIIAGVLNKVLTTNFRISIGHMEDTNSEFLDLPPTRLLLRRLAELLNVAIVIPSTRLHTQVYKPTGPPCLYVGILHVGNSFEQVSTYSPLSCSLVSQSLPRPLLRNPPQDQPLDLCRPGLAEFRSFKKKNQSRDFPKKIKMDVAMPALTVECRHFLTNEIDMQVKKALKVKGVDDQSLRTKCDTMKSKELRRVRTPQTVLAKTTSVIEPAHDMAPGSWDAGDVAKKMKKEKNDTADKMEEQEDWAPHHEYLQTVRDNFDEIWQKALIKNRSQTDSVPKEKEHEVQLRTISVPLEKVLRKDFQDADKTAIKELLTQKQEAMSSHMEELQSALAMAQLEVLQGRFHSEQGSTNEFDIRQILPEAFKIRDTDLMESPSIKVPLVADDFQLNVKRYCNEDARRSPFERDSKDLFNHDCIVYIAARLVQEVSEKGKSKKKQKPGSDNEDFGSDGSDAEVSDQDPEEDDHDVCESGPSSLTKPSLSAGTKRQRPSTNANQSAKALTHPVWNELAAFVRQAWSGDDEFATNAVCPKGMSQSRPEVLKTIATSYHNIWKAKLYLDLKRAVVRYLLRLHLRPLGEQRYRDQKKRFAENKASEAAEKLKSPYVRRKAYRWTAKKVLVQLDEAISTCKTAWNGNILELRDPLDLKDRQSRIARVSNVFRLLRDVVDKTKAADKDIGDLKLKLDRGGSNDQSSNSEVIPTSYDIIELAQEGDDFDGERDLQEEDDFDGECQEEDGLDQAETESAPEPEVVRDALEPTGKHLRGLEAVTCLLLDKSDCPSHVTPAFVREYLFDEEMFNDTEVSTVVQIVNQLRPYTPKRDDENKLHEHISWICEVLCAEDPGHFDVKSNGMTVSYVNRVKNNEKTILGAFFDLDLIHDICGKRHLKFENRLQYVNPWTVQILASKTTKDAAPDLWSEKKKKHIKPPASSKHPSRQQDLISSGISAARAKEFAQKVEETLKVKTNELRQLNRTVTKQTKRQCLLSNTMYDRMATLKTMDVDNEVVADAGRVSAEQVEMEVDEGVYDSTPEPVTAESIQQAYRDLEEQRKLVQSTRALTVPLVLEIKNLKEEKYALNKYSREKADSTTPSTSSPRARSKGRKRSATRVGSTSTDGTSANVNVNVTTSATESPKSPYTSMPSGARPGSMDYIEATCISKLREDIAANNERTGTRQMTLVPGGTDPGSKTLFETVVISESTLISLQNRFHLLSDESDSPPEAIADQNVFEEALKVSRKGALAQIKIPDTHKTTVAKIRHLSGLTQQAKTRKSALERNQHIEPLFSELGESSPHKARTVADFKKSATNRRKARDRLRAFEYSKSMTRKKRNVARRLKRTYDHMASKERQAFKKLGQGNQAATGQEIATDLPSTPSSSISLAAAQRKSNGFCSSCGTHHRPELVADPTHPTGKRLVLKHLRNCPKSLPVVIPLFFHGAAGMGVGSRLKGNCRMGGNEIPRRHKNHGPVGKTNEHNSSKTCPFCFRPIRLARGRRMKKGTMKLVRLNGAVECTNPECISHRCGYTIRGRDQNAALNIAVAGYTQLTTTERTTLPPFSTTTKRLWSHPLTNTGSTRPETQLPNPSGRCDDELNVV